MLKTVSRTVWILSAVSLFTDMASEMLYPVMPVYLKSIGFSILLIGVLEGVAEATAGLSKGYFGRLSDNSGKRTPFVQWGYALSAVSKPMIAVFVFPLWIFLARTIDRIGKGIRTGARDAMLSDEATPQTKGTVFGLHRAMDTLGAVLGPSIALVYLYFYPENYKPLFIIAFVPGLLAVAATFLLRDKPALKPESKKASFLISFSYWNESSAQYKKLLIGLLAFALFNSSDVFLLLKAKEAGLDDSWVIGVYIFYNLVYAAFSLPLGMLADKIGLKNVFVVGLLLFAVTYFGMAVNQNEIVFWLLFLVYGLYAAATEGIAKAWISNISPKSDTATAIGTYSGFQSIFAMLASSLAGIIWFYFGAAATLMLTAVVALLVAVYLFFVVMNPEVKE